MIECDHHYEYKFDPTCTSTVPKPIFNLQDELIWGLSYRDLKRQQANVPIPLKKSPMDIPFKICREKQRKAKRHKKAVAEEKKGSKRKPKLEKPSLLEKSVMSQRQYMEYLSIPKQVKPSKPPPKKKKCRCYIEPCSPRVVQLSLPKKLRVFCNWKDFEHLLPTPRILNLQRILHTDKNLEPKEARYYYKQLDKKKWKLRREKRRQRRKAMAEKEKEKNSWVTEEIKETSITLMDYIKEEPLLSLTFKQLLLSDGILSYLERCAAMKKPSRNTHSEYNKTIIEVCDKIAIWMDTLTRFVDLQAFDSSEDIPPLTISSIEGEEGEEEEGSSETSLFSEEDKIRGLWGEDMYGEEDMFEGGGFADTKHRKRSGSESEKMISDLLSPHEGEGESDIDAFLDELDIDLLEKLIKILSNCSDEFLDEMVNEEKMPGVRYIDILNRVKELRDGILSHHRPKPFLEEVILNWAIQNEPDEIDDKMKHKIQETAALLGDFLHAARKSGASGGTEEGLGEGEEGIGETIEHAGEVEEGLGEEEKEAEEEKEGDEGKEEAEGGPDAESEAVEEVPIEKTEAGALLTEVTEETEPVEEQDEVTEEEGEIIGHGEGGDVEAGVTGEEGDVGDAEGDVGDAEGEAGVTEGAEEEEGLDEGVPLEAEGAEEAQLLDYEKEEELLAGYEKEGFEDLGLEEGEGVVSVLYGPPGEELEGRIIKGHQPPAIIAHRPDMVCCLSLKIWTVWLLDITHNAHNWTRWIHCIIQKVKEFAAVVRGDVLLPNGEKKVLYKEDWRKFAKETEEMIIAWRQYSTHVKDLSNSIIDSFHGKKVLNCCPKCLQDHLIKDVVTAHETLEALTEAINCANYWQRCLDELVIKTCPVSGADAEAEAEKESTSTSSEDSDESEPCVCRKTRTKRRPKKQEQESSESEYEIEEIDVSRLQGAFQRGWGRGGPGPRPDPSMGGPSTGGCRPNTRRF